MQSTGSSIASSSTQPSHPPETLEGWYVLHQIFSVVPGTGKDSTPPRVDSTRVPSILGDESEGWSAFVRLIGSKSDYMAMHFRSTLDAIGVAQYRLAALPEMDG